MSHATGRCTHALATRGSPATSHRQRAATAGLACSTLYIDIDATLLARPPRGVGQPTIADALCSFVDARNMR